MTLEIVPEKVSRRFSHGDAVLITHKNIVDVAQFFGLEYYADPFPHIRVPLATSNPRLFRHATAEAGNWIVVLGGSTFRVFDQETYQSEFVPMVERKNVQDRNAEVLRLVTSAMNKQDAATYHGESSRGMDVVAKETADNIIKQF